VNIDLLVVLLQLLDQFHDSCFVFEVLFLFLEKVATFSTRRFLGRLDSFVILLFGVSTRINSVGLKHNSRIVLGNSQILSHLFLLLVKLHFEVLDSLFLLLDFTVKHFLILLNLVQLANELDVFRSLLLNLSVVSIFTFDGIDFESRDLSLFVSEFSVELLNMFNVFLLTEFGVSGI